MQKQNGEFFEVKSNFLRNTVLKKECVKHSLFLCLQCDSADTRTAFRATGSEREPRPKGFDERINVYPLETFSQKNRRVNIYLVHTELKWQN